MLLNRRVELAKHSQRAKASQFMCALLGRRTRSEFGDRIRLFERAYAADDPLQSPLFQAFFSFRNFVSAARFMRVE